MKMTTGKIGEKIAARYLIQNGYKIIQTNYHTREGEIDIICQQGNDIIFVEVKTRSNKSGGYPEEAVTPIKLRRLTAAIEHYLQFHNIKDLSPRLDVISIEFDKEKKPKISHFKNVSFDS